MGDRLRDIPLHVFWVFTKVQVRTTFPVLSIGERAMLHFAMPVQRIRRIDL
jgi:hypothetical protein